MKIKLLNKTPGAKRRVWQASIWSGPTPEALTQSVIYGDSLGTLRHAASSWFYEYHPDCFSNVPSWYLQQPVLSKIPRRLWALYVLRQMEYIPFVSDVPSAQPLQGDATAYGRRKRRRLVQQSKLGDEATPPPPMSSETEHVPEEECSHTQVQDSPVQLNWNRMGVNDEGREYATPFLHTADAVYSFLHQDLLIAKGPDFREEILEAMQWNGLEFRQVKTVKVVDDEEIANDMLYRGGWSLLKVLGKLAPSRKDKTVLFVLGHVEEYAV